MADCPVCRQDAHPAMARRYHGCCSSACEDTFDARREADALREALAWYADPVNYEPAGAPGRPAGTYGAWICDRGQHAREVLREQGWELGEAGQLVPVHYGPAPSAPASENPVP